MVVAVSFLFGLLHFWPVPSLAIRRPVVTTECGPVRGIVDDAMGELPRTRTHTHTHTHTG